MRCLRIPVGGAAYRPEADDDYRLLPLENDFLRHARFGRCPAERAEIEDAIELLRDARRDPDATFPARLRHLAAQSHPVRARRQETSNGHACSS